MGPADMVPCLELSVTAPKCREKSVQKVHTSSYKRMQRQRDTLPREPIVVIRVGGVETDPESISR